ncbi:p23 chaperone protein wos2 [Cryptotrichosporon argae]
MSSPVLHPEITWAQRSSTSEPEKNIIYLTINTPDVRGEPTLELKPDHISFKATTGGANGVPEKQYAFDIDLFAEIVPEETKKNLTSRALVLIIRKKALELEYWPRLTKDKVKNQWIKTDFSKWVDEDEQDGADAFDESDFGGMGGAGGAGMPGAGGPGGMDFASMMGGMGGAGGAGGAGGMDFASMMGGMGGGGADGGMDFAKIMEQMKASGQFPEGGEDDEGDDEGEGDDEHADHSHGDEAEHKEASLDDVE